MKFLQWLSGLRELRVARSIDHDERRRLPRLRCYFKVAVEGPTGPHGEAYVVEMNSQGVRFHCNQKYSEGQALHLHYHRSIPGEPQPQPSLSSVPVRVIWGQSRTSLKAVVGCQFLLPPDRLKQSWAGYILQQLGFPVDQEPHTLSARQSIRYPAQLEASVQTRLSSCDVTVLDLGAGGALVEAPMELSEDVVLDILDPPGLPSKLRILCRCINCRPSPSEGRTLCHLQWVYLTPQETRNLGVLLFKLLRQGAEG